MRRSAPSGYRRRFRIRSQQLKPPVPSGRPPQGGRIRRSPCAWPTDLAGPTGSMGRSHPSGPAARFGPIATGPSDHSHRCPPEGPHSAPGAASLALAQLPPTPLRSPEPGSDDLILANPPGPSVADRFSSSQPARTRGFRMPRFGAEYPCLSSTCWWQPSLWAARQKNSFPTTPPRSSRSDSSWSLSEQRSGSGGREGAPDQATKRGRGRDATAPSLEGLYKSPPGRSASAMETQSFTP